ncbi:MAG: hypothetical protein SPL13_04280 [Clostridia bacterium]|nr:hypothetical protein [Clostridia bacterium]
MKKSNLKAVSQKKTKPSVKSPTKKAEKTVQKTVSKKSSAKSTAQKRTQKFYTVSVNVCKADTIQTYTEIQNGNLRPFASINDVKVYSSKAAAKKQAKIIENALPTRKGVKITSFISEY